MDQILKNGKVERAYLGILPQDVTPAMAKAFGAKEAKGAVVYATGRGALDVPRFDGEFSAPLGYPMAAVSVQIGGVDAQEAMQESQRD